MSHVSTLSCTRRLHTALSLRAASLEGVSGDFLSSHSVSVKTNLAEPEGEWLEQQGEGDTFRTGQKQLEFGLAEFGSVVGSLGLQVT